jgi:hypothetical protein
MDAPLMHESTLPVVWIVNVQCQGVPTLVVRVLKDKTISQLKENIIEQGSELDDELRGIEYILKQKNKKTKKKSIHIYDL